MAPILNELSAPPDATEQGGHEVLRAFVVEGALSIAVQRAFDDPGVWGRLLADVARYVAGLYGRESQISEEDALNEIRHMIEVELGAGGSSPMN